jgi:hypothetical protein
MGVVMALQNWVYATDTEAVEEQEEGHVVKDKIMKEGECNFLIRPNYVASSTHSLEK